MKDKYEPVRLIGAGGMAEVWKATVEGAAGFKKTVAIKKILPHLAGDKEFVSRFISEARLAAELVHPNIVQVFDFGELDWGSYFLAMEYVPGTDALRLAARVEKERRLLPPEVVLHIGIEAAKGLSYAHSRKPPLVHRDVSPQNVLLSFEGDVKLADFGIAKAAVVRGVGKEAGTVEMVQGNVGYVSPEQVRGLEVDGRSDLFSLGATLYRLFTGLPFNGGETFPERLAAATNYAGLPPAALARLPEEVRAVIEHAVRARPEDRYSTAEEMEAALGQCLDRSTTITTRRALASLTRQHFAEDFRREEKEASGAMVTRPSAVVPMGAVGSAGPDRGYTAERKAMKRRRLGRVVPVVGGAAVLMVGAVLGETFHPLGRMTGSYRTTIETATATPVALAATSPAAIATATGTATATAAATATVTPTPLPTATASPKGVASPRRTRVAAATATPRPAASRTPVAVSTASEDPPKIVRRVLQHDASFLQGCSDGDRELLSQVIQDAIHRGAPVYNRGDISGCAQIYSDTVVTLREALSAECAGPREDLKKGLDRAEGMGSAAEKAWALRDTFDGELGALGPAH